MSKSAPGAVSRADGVGVNALIRPNTRWLCALIVLGVAVVALAIRWPNLLLFPRFADETREALWAVAIARGENYPLTHFNSYIGVVQPYLLAALFRVFGLHAALPRAVSAVFGALLAGLVAWLAWQFAVRDPRCARGGAGSAAIAALLAGGLVATSFPLIAVNSHLGWSNCLTPFFTTLALGVTWLAVVEAHPWWLVLSGFLWGVALQTHPTVIVLLPGVALWVVLHPTGRSWLRRRWPWLTLVAFAVGYANMIWYNIMTRGGAVEEVLRAGNTYRTEPGVGERLAAAAQMSAQIARMLAGAYTIGPDGEFPLQITPAVALYAALALLALIWSARRIQTAVLPLIVVSGLVLLPLVTDTFVGFHDTRYVAPILPPIYLALALAGVSLWETWRVRASGVRRTLAGAAIALVAAALVALPLLSLGRFYDDSERYGLTNAPFIETAAEAHVEAANGMTILLDRETSHIPLSGGGNTRRALEYLLTMNGDNFQVEPVDSMRWFLANSQAPLFLILSDESYAALAAQHTLTPTPWRGPGFAAYVAHGGP